MREKLARTISWVGHPLVFVMVSVAVVLTRQMASTAAWPILACLFFSVILPMAVLLIVGLRSGRWKDADVSNREERTRFYRLAIPISVLGVAASWMIHAPFLILRGGVVTLGLFVLAAVINTRLKISLHTLFAFYCVVILFRVDAAVGMGALALAVLIFWSRLYLGRHTVAENITGTVVGLAGGILAAGWPR
jgi:membrane-associated phospholipid phosphatase